MNDCLFHTDLYIYEHHSGSISNLFSKYNQGTFLIHFTEAIQEGKSAGIHSGSPSQLGTN
jgi:hypothetical protein